MRNNKGENSVRWKGDNIKKGSMHDWLRANFGNPPECELCYKKGEKVGLHIKHWDINWAKLKWTTKPTMYVI